ncbi:MAG TPA: threonine synthase [Streptosporangiaceae bacterium]
MTRTFSALSHLDCSQCQVRFDAAQSAGTCTCGSPLLARYDLEVAASLVTPAVVARRPPSLWRYHELLPVGAQDRVVSFSEGLTPLLGLPRMGRALGMPGLLMKDESPLPTGTFKARGASVGVSRAAELGAAGVAMPTNGNAGAAWSAYCARAALPCFIAMPAGAPDITRTECLAAGAEVAVVPGLIGDAAIVASAFLTQRPGWQDASTFREPYRLEGKKTIGFEIAEQLGWRIPDVIICPVGGGVALIGIWKALAELAAIGWIGPDLPRLVAVQAAGCAPVVDAFEAGAAMTAPWPDAASVAFGLTVPAPLGGVLVLTALRATGGTAIAVTDADLLAAQARLARAEGTWICPEGAAGIAAAAQLRESGWLSERDEVVVLNTGTGLKYADPPGVTARAPRQ